MGIWETKRISENSPGEPRSPKKELFPEFSEEEIEDMLEGFENETEIEALLVELSDEQIDKIMSGWENAEKWIAEKLRSEKNLSNRDILRIFFLASSEKRSVRKITPGTVGIAAFPRYVKRRYPDLFKDENAVPETRRPLSKEGGHEYKKPHSSVPDIPKTRRDVPRTIKTGEDIPETRKIKKAA